MRVFRYSALALLASFLALTCLNYINKAFLITYELDKNERIYLRDPQVSKVIAAFAAIDRNKEDILVKLYDHHLSIVFKPDGYTFFHIGFCNYRECIEVSNSTGPHDVEVIRRKNSLISDSSDKSKVEKIIRFLENSDAATGSTLRRAQEKL